MSLATVLVFCLTGTASASPPAAPEAPPWGPFYQRSHAAMADNRLSYTGREAPVVPAGAMRLDLGLSEANVWAQMPGYFYDGEWSRLQARFTYGIATRWEVWAELALVGRSGGFLDGFIEGFHRTFGITQARRNLYPRDRLLIATLADGVQTDRLTPRDAGVGLANPVLAGKYLLAGADGRAPALAVELALQLPTGSTGAQFATPCVGGLAALSVTQPLGTMFRVDAAFGLILVPGMRNVYGMALSETQKFLSVTLQVRLGSQAVLAVAYLNQDGIADNAAFYPLSATSHEFLVGVRVRAGGVAWEAGIIENTVHDANTADFGFFAGGAYTL